MTGLIIFGAGASKGSDQNGTPPLGKDLFYALRAFNPDGWGKLPPTLLSVFTQDFERGMTQLDEQNPHWMPILQRTMAAYFFNFSPLPSNLYRRLARRIKTAKWNGAFATLNYERLLELSLLAESLQPIIGETGNSGQIELCLPHGCCHIFCDAVRGLASGVSFMGTGIQTNGSPEDFKIIGNLQEFNQRINQDAFPPVMSYFEPQKRTTSGANLIEAQRERYSHLISDASVIAIVGMRVRIYDKHIWKPLAETKAKLVYCGGNQGGREFDSWRATERKTAQDKTLYSYFSDAFDEICRELSIGF